MDVGEKAFCCVKRKNKKKMSSGTTDFDNRRTFFVLKKRLGGWRIEKRAKQRYDRKLALDFNCILNQRQKCVYWKASTSCPCYKNMRSLERPGPVNKIAFSDKH